MIIEMHLGQWKQLKSLNLLQSFEATYPLRPPLKGTILGPTLDIYMSPINPKPKSGIHDFKSESKCRPSCCSFHRCYKPFLVRVL